jgi:hypothetical protein
MPDGLVNLLYNFLIQNFPSFLCVCVCVGVGGGVWGGEVMLINNLFAVTMLSLFGNVQIKLKHLDKLLRES